MVQNKEYRRRKISIIIPVLNEGVNLRMMLKIIKATIEVPHEVLVVYDSLDDNSIPVVKAVQKNYPSLRGIHNKLGRGVINAIKSGVNNSRGDYVLILSADDIGPLLTVEDMVYLMDKGCDFVSATRYAHGGRILGGYLISRLLSRIANKSFYLLSRSALSDLTLGVKMFRRSIFNKLSLEAKPVGWAVAFEFAIKAQLAGLKLGEVPIISINRFYGGKSSFKLGPWVIEYTKWFVWGIIKLNPIGGRREVALRVPVKLSASRKKNDV
ncbi:MAG: glycosyltransferase [Nanoarchaeota archaeon]|mgnify:CR=1 FL=1